MDLCINKGEIESTGSYVGGIVGEGSLELTNSHNEGIVKVTASDVDGQACAGGIAGVSNKDIEECYNIGKVQAIGKDMNNNSTLGGLCGFIYEDIQIVYCYNRGDVISEYSMVGGMVGHQTDESTITNSYNTFQVSNGANRSCFVGYAASGTTQNQCYYLGTTTSGKQITESDMKNNEFINLLGGTSKWKLDTSNKNDGFVILSWQ